MYKRFSCLLAGVLAAVMLLSACGSTQPRSSSAPPDGSLSLEPSVSVLAPVTEPEPLYTNPLTGEGTDVDLSANRPVAIMLNN